MKTHENAILLGLRARIQQLKSQLKESNAIDHDGTRGELREAYLKQFFHDFISMPFEITSGFMTDSSGSEISPQIDLIIYDRSSILGFPLNDLVMILPVESVRVIMEIKSTVRGNTLKQARTQQDAIRQMRLVLTEKNRKYLTAANCRGIPQIIVGYKSDCGGDALKSWFDEEPELRAICIIEKQVIIRDPTSGKVEVINCDDNGSELLHVLSILQHETIRTSPAEAVLKKLPDKQRQLPMVQNFARSFHADIGAYTTYDVPIPNSSYDKSDAENTMESS